jgi:hypothetical protein
MGIPGAVYLIKCIVCVRSEINVRKLHEAVQNNARFAGVFKEAWQMVCCGLQ